MLAHSFEELRAVVKVLNERVWNNRLSMPTIDRWLENFQGGDRERHLAINLLAQFVFFGQCEIRELLRSLYRDLYRHPILEGIREEHGGVFDASALRARLDEELVATRFLGVGNPSESGTHLLYYFRQENKLSKEQFLNVHEVFKRDAGSGVRTLRNENVRHYVFIDDICGSGTQAREYSREVVEEIKSFNANAKVYYYALFGLKAGLDDVRGSTLFDRVDALSVLDSSFQCLGEGSRYFLPAEQADRVETFDTMSRYGERLFPGHSLGYKGSQLLIGFFYNVPDNTLPIIWADSDNWAPIFRRYTKLY